MVNTVTLRQTAYAGMQRQWQTEYGADRRGKHKLSGIVKQVGSQAGRQADSGNQHVGRGRQVVQRQ
jgi:hypothetical protein